MSEALVIDGEGLTLRGLSRLLGPERPSVRVDEEACRRVVRSRETIERVLAEGRPVYGVNTGFGRLADRRISDERLAQLQRNLVLSHSAGVGRALSEDETRLLIVLRANALAKGFSGVRLETLASLVALVNAGITPVIPERGSVGASGDLAPLAHLACCLIGEGEAVLAGERLAASEALARCDLSPVELAPKEGLCLINGTQMMTAIGGRAAILGRRLAVTADVIAAMSIDALKGTDAASDERIHRARPHPGQVAVAANVRALLAGSAIRESHRDHSVCAKVQDAYSLRCVPQVHGAVRDNLGHVEAVLEREMNSATDNPLVFPDEGDVLSGGNFHGEPVAIVLDLLAIALSELAGISERRLERLVNPDYSSLPAFLVKEEGLNSGFMMAQVTAAALVSENKVLSHPASVDSIPTSAGFEDHVSMGVTAALKARDVLMNAECVLAIELLAACQGLEFHRPLRSSGAIEAVHALVRSEVPPLDRDRALAPDIERVRCMVEDGRVLAAAEAGLGKAID